MRVDSYRFLPRSFRGLYENAGPLPGEQEPVWAPFTRRLAESRIALLTSAGLHLRDTQTPFDAERERREPTWGDPGWRSIPANTPSDQLDVTHLHINPDDILADHNVALPSDVLAALVEDGVVGASTSTHLSVMGYQEQSLADWRERTAPELVQVLRDERADGIILAPV